MKQRDTIYVDQFQFGTTFNQPDITILQWFSVNEKFPVLELSYQSGFALQSWYLDQLHVGQIELYTEIKCYPNPTNDFNYKIKSYVCSAVSVGRAEQSRVE